MQVPKWLIAVAGILLLVLIVAVAFFVGRETSRSPAEGLVVQAAPQAASAAEALTQEPSRVLTAVPSGAPAPSPTADTSPAPPAVPSGAPAPGPTADTSPAPPEARARVEAYFKQMEAIRSGGAAGDPQDFATTLLTSATSGDLSGFDDLVRVASDAELRAGELKPPPECAEYHRQAVTLLGESKTMITALRDGLKRNDTNAVASAGASAQGLKIRAEGLAEVEKAVRKRFGL